MNRIEGKVCLITGAGGGIGSATAHTLARSGGTVVLADIDEARGSQVARDIDAQGLPASFHGLDVRDESAWTALIAAIERDHGRLDVLVNNAAILQLTLVESTSLDDWREVMGTNVEGTFLGTKSALPLLRKSAEARGGFSSIINLSSLAGIVGSSFQPAYSASKAAIHGFSKACAIEFANLGYKVRVNTVHPGGIDTQMIADYLGKLAAQDPSLTVEGMRTGLVSQVPMGRIGMPDDIARAILFLASDDSEYMHGSEMVVDGGYLAQ